MIGRLPSVAGLVWIAIVVCTLATLLAFVLGLVTVMGFTVVIIVRAAYDTQQRAEEDRRAAMRDAAHRQEIAEHRRRAVDWGWPR